MERRCVKVTLENFYGQDNTKNTKLAKASEVFLNKIWACGLDCDFTIDEGVDEINTLLMEQFKMLHKESECLGSEMYSNSQAMIAIATYLKE